MFFLTEMLAGVDCSILDRHYRRFRRNAMATLSVLLPLITD